MGVGAWEVHLKLGKEKVHAGRKSLGRKEGEAAVEFWNSIEEPE